MAFKMAISETICKGKKLREFNDRILKQRNNNWEYKYFITIIDELYVFILLRFAPTIQFINLLKIFSLIYTCIINCPHKISTSFKEKII